MSSSVFYHEGIPNVFAQVEKYVEDIRALAEERDRLVSQLQEDNRLLKSELIHTKTPTQRMNKWYLEVSQSIFFQSSPQLSQTADAKNYLEKIVC